MNKSFENVFGNEFQSKQWFSQWFSQCMSEISLASAVVSVSKSQWLIQTSNTTDFLMDNNIILNKLIAFISTLLMSLQNSYSFPRITEMCFQTVHPFIHLYIEFSIKLQTFS